MKIKRPLLRWHGGKWKLREWIIGHMPRHRVYTEAFGGAASVLIAKPRAYGEVYNDLEGEVVNLFQVLREAALADRLIDLLKLTCFARDEWELARQVTQDPVERARRLIVRSFMGFGSDATRLEVYTGFRAKSDRSGTTPPRDWERYPEALKLIVGRLKGVVIENREAIACLAQHDSDRTLHYVDPPYVHATRQRVGKSRGYIHELTDDEHQRLLLELCRLKGMVMLSAYPSPLYEDMLRPRGWLRLERDAFADQAQPRTEVLWLNPAASPKHVNLFSQLQH